MANGQCSWQSESEYKSKHLESDSDFCVANLHLSWNSVDKNEYWFPKTTSLLNKWREGERERMSQKKPLMSCLCIKFSEQQEVRCFVLLFEKIVTPHPFWGFRNRQTICQSNPPRQQSKFAKELFWIRWKHQHPKGLGTFTQLIKVGRDN